MNQDNPNPNEHHLPSQRRAIFRDEALQKYVMKGEKSLPASVKPKFFLLLWIVAIALFSIGVLTWLAEVPIYVSGDALVVPTNRSPETASLLVLVPAEYRDQLVGAEFVHVITPNGEVQRQTIVNVGDDILNPIEIAAQFSQYDAQAVDSWDTQSAAVITADFTPLLPNTTADDYFGNRYDANVELGTQRIIALLPVVGRAFD